MLAYSPQICCMYRGVPIKLLTLFVCAISPFLSVTLKELISTTYCLIALRSPPFLSTSMICKSFFDMSSLPVPYLCRTTQCLSNATLSMRRCICIRLCHATSCWFLRRHLSRHGTEGKNINHQHPWTPLVHSWGLS